MGYTTDFTGKFTITPTLKPEHRAYLLKFADTRRMRRNEFLTVKRPDPVREAVGLPVGQDGQYFVGEGGFMGGADGSDVVDSNSPPRGQPGLYCQWAPNELGDTLAWDGGEKFYYYVEWLEYFVVNFLAPWGYQLNGTVEYQGEDPGDFGKIIVKNNDVTQKTGKRVYE